MDHVLIIHEVDDYLAWKAGFDKAASLRKAAGEIAYQVLHYDSDPNRVVHFSKWSSLSAARSFFESEEVQQIRKDLGVKAPEFIYLREQEAGQL